MRRLQWCNLGARIVTMELGLKSVYRGPLRMANRFIIIKTGEIFEEILKLCFTILHVHSRETMF
jgi:hypothetical protein